MMEDKSVDGQIPGGESSSSTSAALPSVHLSLAAPLPANGPYSNSTSSRSFDDGEEGGVRGTEAAASVVDAIPGKQQHPQDTKNKESNRKRLPTATQYELEKAELLFSIRGWENVHIYMWIVKDLAWTLNNLWMSAIAGSIAVAWCGVLVWIAYRQDDWEECYMLVRILFYHCPPSLIFISYYNRLHRISLTRIFSFQSTNRPSLLIIIVTVTTTTYSQVSTILWLGGNFWWMAAETGVRIALFIVVLLLSFVISLSVCLSVCLSPS
jgi:hypothetical protein